MLYSEDYDTEQIANSPDGKAVASHDHALQLSLAAGPHRRGDGDQQTFRLQAPPARPPARRLPEAGPGPHPNAKAPFPPSGAVVAGV